MSDLDDLSAEVALVTRWIPFSKLKLVAPEYLIDELLPPRGVGVIYGPTGSGKTAIVTSMCVAISAGVPWFKRDTQQGVTVHFMLEGNANSAAARYKAACLKTALTPDQQALTDKNYIYIDRTPPMNEDGGEMVRTELQNIVETLGPIKCVFVDTLAASFKGEENSASDVGAYLEICKSLGNEFECLFVVVHHTGKDVARGARGSGAIRANVDSMFETQFHDENSEANREGKLFVEKAKDGPAGFSINYGWEPVAFDEIKDRKGRSMTAIVAIPRGETEIRNDGRTLVELSLPQMQIYNTIRDTTSKIAVLASEFVVTLAGVRYIPRKQLAQMVVDYRVVTEEGKERSLVNSTQKSITRMLQENPPAICEVLDGDVALLTLNMSTRVK